MLVWETRDDKKANEITTKLFENSQNIVKQIGAWDKPRRPQPTKGKVRITFLVSDGLYFGEGPIDVLFNDPMASPALTTATELMKYLTENPEWVTFYPEFNSSMYLEKAGYFDERPLIYTSITQLIALVAIPALCIFSFWFLLGTPLVFFGWGKLYISLPIKTGIEDCDSAGWGFDYHNNRIWIYIGGGGNFEGGKKWKTITMPWNMEWVRTSTKLQNEQWFHETKNTKLNWGEGKEKIGGCEWLEKNKWTETHPFLDKFDNATVQATIAVVEREWRPLWFKWTSLFSKVRRTIDISFDKEVGEGKGSWKGGTTGCGYDIVEGETPYQCLKRMEKERDFR